MVSHPVIEPGLLVLVHTERLRQRSATKMGYIGCLLDVLRGVTVTANCDCDTLVSQGVTDMIAVNGSCTHLVQQVSSTPYTHPTTPIVVDSIAVAVAPCELPLSARSHGATVNCIKKNTLHPAVRGQL